MIRVVIDAGNAEEQKKTPGKGQVFLFRVKKTAKGAKVKRLDGRGLAEGYYEKRDPRYFYGEHAEEMAHRYARKKAREVENGRFVGLGERV